MRRTIRCGKIQASRDLNTSACILQRGLLGIFVGVQAGRPQSGQWCVLEWHMPPIPCPGRPGRKCSPTMRRYSG